MLCSFRANVVLVSTEVQPTLSALHAAPLRWTLHVAIQRCALRPLASACALLTSVQLSHGERKTLRLFNIRRVGVRIRLLA